MSLTARTDSRPEARGRRAHDEHTQSLVTDNRAQAAYLLSQFDIPYREFQHRLQLVCALTHPFFTMASSVTGP